MATNYLAKADEARRDAARKRRWAQQALDIAAHRDCSRDDRDKHRAHAAELIRDAEVDERCAAMCEQWHAEALEKSRVAA